MYFAVGGLSMLYYFLFISLLFYGNIRALAPLSFMAQRLQPVWNQFQDAIENESQDILDQLSDEYKGNILKDLRKIEPQFIAQQSKKVIFFLCNNGYDLECVDKQGYTALHHACKQGHLKRVQNLVECGAHLGARTKDEEGKTGFLLAAQGGYLEVMTYLLSEGDDVDQQDKRGRTVFHLAAESGHLPTIKYLSGPNVNWDMKDKRGRTALHFASKRGHFDVVEYLLGLGCDLNHQNDDGETALHLAAESGNLNLVKHLLEQGADINEQDLQKETVLYKAAVSGHMDVVAHLLRKKSPIVHNDFDVVLPLMAQWGDLSLIKTIFRRRFVTVTELDGADSREGSLLCCRIWACQCDGISS